ncbi:ead/Ea22-like family protein [Pseudomonas aeruginosa]
MTDHAELRRLAKAATPGPWEYQAPLKILAADRTSIVLIALSHANYREDEANSRLIAAANPKTILALLDEIDGMKASGWRNHSVNYARAEKCPQTLETAQAAWDRDQELIEEQRQQIARDSQTINQLRQKLQSAEVDRDRLKAENEVLRRFAAEAYQVLGALDAPENVLDNASDAAHGVPLRHETLLPFFAEDYESMQKDAARYRWLRDSCTRQWDVMCRDIEIVINGDGAEDCEDLDGIIDAALEGATQ